MGEGKGGEGGCEGGGGAVARLGEERRAMDDRSSLGEDVGGGWRL